MPYVRRKNPEWVAECWHTHKSLVARTQVSPELKTSIRAELQRNIDGNIDNFDPDKCAYWTGEQCSNSKHGVFRHNGFPLAAYRLLWEIDRGWLPPKTLLRHMCQSNGQCCNLHHLRPGDSFDNFVDRQEQGSYKGPHIGEVIGIYETGTNPAPDRIKPSQMLRIAEGKAWKPILDDTELARKKRLQWGLQEDPPMPMSDEAYEALLLAVYEERKEYRKKREEMAREKMKTKMRERREYLSGPAEPTES